MGVLNEKRCKTCFSACKTKSLMVIVTTSGIKPYQCNTGEALMNSWIADHNIDYISPQLYGGDGTTLVTQPLTLFNSIQNKILPSIPYDSDWSKLNIDNIGINPAGYIIWNVSSSTPPPPPQTNTNFCGVSWPTTTCDRPCPNGDSECTTPGESCYANITKCSSKQLTNYCGVDWITANSTCSGKCPNSQDSQCPAGQRCFANLTGCTPY